jgi:hypothetical protein
MPLIYNTDKADSCLNTYREVFSDPLKSGDDNAFTGDVILPLDFSLEMDGLSGIIPHSAFTIPEDSLPNSYIIQDGPDKGLTKIAFILHTIDQNFGNNKWTTKITGQTLNIRFEPMTDAEKKAIKDAQTSQNSMTKYKDIGNTKKVNKNPPDPPIKVTKEMRTFAEAVKAVIVNLEGGYYNGGGNGDPRYNTSGETMFGIDRLRNGTCGPCTRFWKVMDDNNARTNWPWLYVPKDPIKSNLFNLTVEIQKPYYEKWAKSYLNENVRTLVESDGRLYYNMVYAAWNGPGWFKGFASLLNNAYSRGYKTSDSLLDVITKERTSGGKIAYTLGTGKNLGDSSASLIQQTGYKIAKATGVKV